VVEEGSGESRATCTVPRSRAIEDETRVGTVSFEVLKLAVVLEVEARVGTFGCGVVTGLALEDESE
jgi:hypothetical protein